MSATTCRCGHPEGRHLAFGCMAGGCPCAGFSAPPAPAPGAAPTMRETVRNICDSCETTYVVGADYAPHRCDLEAIRGDVGHWQSAERTAVILGQRARGSLRVFREQRGLSLREVARLAGVSPAALSQQERDPAHPTLGADAVARVLDVIADGAR